MTVSPYDIALIGVGGTIIGALLGAWVSYRLSISLSQLSARRESGRSLILAFSEELAKLDPVSDITGLDVHKYLENTFPKHFAAMIAFGFYLSGDRKVEYERTCAMYYECHGSVRFFDYWNGLEGRKVFKKRVTDILNFTK